MNKYRVEKVGAHRYVIFDEETDEELAKGPNEPNVLRKLARQKENRVQ